MAQGLAARVVGIAGADPLFARIRQEAEEAIRREPELALFLSVNVLNHHTLEGAVSHRVASRLDHPEIPAALIPQTSSGKPLTKRSRASPRSGKRSMPTSWRAPIVIRRA